MSERSGSAAEARVCSSNGLTAGRRGCRAASRSSAAWAARGSANGTVSSAGSGIAGLYFGWGGAFEECPALTFSGCGEPIPPAPGRESESNDHHVHDFARWNWFDLRPGAGRGVWRTRSSARGASLRRRRGVWSARRRPFSGSSGAGRLPTASPPASGAFKDRLIPPDQVEALQRNILVSHAVGVGAPFDRPTTRAMMLIRANTLARGHSGVRLETLNLLLEMLNRGVHPLVPQKGSLGASGDLAPLAHMALPLIGEGQAEYQGEVLPGAGGHAPRWSCAGAPGSQRRPGADQRDGGDDRAGRAANPARRAIQPDGGYCRLPGLGKP